MKLDEIQRALRAEQLDGWLFFDHHHRDPLAYRVLGLPAGAMAARPWYYFIPSEGEPLGLVNRIEAHRLDGLPGRKIPYSGWEEQKRGIASLVDGARRIAMQYSPECAVPYVSMVDGGTLELVRAAGVEVASSADLIQYFESRWSAEQLESHLEAGKLVDEIRRAAFRFIGENLRAGRRVTECDAQQLIKEGFARHDLFADHGPDVAVNANASNPHYDPQPDSCSEIRAGDMVLIDLWAKFNRPGAVYYDITWMGFCGTNPPSALERIFSIVKTARDRAIARVREAAASGEALRGFQVDDAARSYIREQGYGEHFFHRTGHSIGQEIHGSGANMDNLETHDERRVIPWTGFSIEPGIYLPEFGVRSEVNVFVDETGARVTGEVQDSLVLV